MNEPKEEPTGTAPQSILGNASRDTALRSVGWVAEFLGVSKSWVYQATATGVLPCIRLGASLRFEKSAIERWLKGEAASRSVKLPSCR